MLKIPYGESNFVTVRTKGYFYQDRTAFIRDLENAPSFVYYLRPRQFGKSLFVSMLEHYYALEHQNQFNELFGQLAIGKNPTPLANQYMVLKFEFTGIQTNTPANTFEGFLSSIRDSVKVFLNQYDHIFPPNIHAAILEKKATKCRAYFSLNLMPKKANTAQISLIYYQDLPILLNFLPKYL